MKGGSASFARGGDASPMIVINLMGIQERRGRTDKEVICGPGASGLNCVGKEGER